MGKQRNFTARSSGWWLAGGLSLTAAMGCQAGSGRYLNYSIESRDGDGAWASNGGGCILDQGDGGASSSAGGSLGDGYEISLVSDEGRTHFTAIVNGVVIEKRTFDRTFLRAGDVEVFTIALPDGRAERYSFWSSAQCEGPYGRAEPDAGIDPSRGPSLSSP